MSADRALLRSISIATALPLALGSSFASAADLKGGHQNLPIVNFEGATADLQLTPFMMLVQAGQSTSATASTLDSFGTNTLPETASTVVGRSADVADLDLDFLTRSMSQIGELLQSPSTDLPDEQPIRNAAVAAAIEILLDLQDLEIPVPSVIARGDGGLQLIWYTQDRDLEIEILPRGGRSIVEFDGTKTRRLGYSAINVASAVDAIRQSLSAQSAAA